MNVRQLIAKLEKLDPKTRVVVVGYEEGLDDPKVYIAEIYDIQGTDVKRTWWAGRYSADATDSRAEGKVKIKAVVIGRGGKYA